MFQGIINGYVPTCRSMCGLIYQKKEEQTPWVSYSKVQRSISNPFNAAFNLQPICSQSAVNPLHRVNCCHSKHIKVCKWKYDEAEMCITWPYPLALFWNKIFLIFGNQPKQGYQAEYSFSICSCILWKIHYLWQIGQEKHITS